MCFARLERVTLDAAAKKRDIADIRVSDVLNLLAVGLTTEQVVKELSDLEREDVAACLRFASRRLGQPVLAA